MGTANGKKKYPNDPEREVFEAARSGDAVLLEEVLQEMNSSQSTSALETKMDASFRYDVNEYETFKVTPLMLAVKNGNLDCVKVLLNYKADIECRGGDDDDDDDDDGRGVKLDRKYSCRGCTPLIVAATYGHLDVLTCLIANGADVNTRSKYDCTALMIASRYGHLNIVMHLTKHGVNMDLQDKNGKTALHYAVDSFDVLSCLIRNGADVNACTNDNCTPLMIASEKGHVNEVTFLIEHGANVKCQDKTGETALHHAARYYGTNLLNSFGVLSCLIINGADVNARIGTEFWTFLMIASKNQNINLVTFLIEQGANMDLQDKNGKTALHYAFRKNLLNSFPVLNCLIKNGADVNARIGIEFCTLLMIASQNHSVNLVTSLIEKGANVNLQDKNGNTALHYAVGSLDVLSCLIRNGADVNACTNDNCTPLMTASLKGQMNAVTFLIEHGANIDHQDKLGDNALHCAVYGESSEVLYKLLSLGASQLCNNRGLTPLLLASNLSTISVVEDLIKVPQYTKEQKIDALELLGASLAADQDIEAGFKYMKHGMEERFADPLHSLVKQPMEPVEAYQNRKESQTLEELAQIEHDRNAIIMEGLMIRERILGTNSIELLDTIRCVAGYYKVNNSHSISIELYVHAMKIAQQCNQSGICDLHELTSLLSYLGMWSYVLPLREEVFLELLEQTVIEYEKQQKLRRLNGYELELLFDSTIKLVLAITKLRLYEEGKSSCLSGLLKRLCCLNPRDECGDTLLHKALRRRLKLQWTDADNLYGNLDTVKLLLNAGLSVNTINNNGDTPLHRIVTFEARSEDEMHLFTDMLEVLLDGGAHHDFVNNDGKTAMDLAKTDEARWILSEKRKLELKCISARAVKKFGLPYLGVVPKMLEKYISMH